LISLIASNPRICGMEISRKYQIGLLLLRDFDGRQAVAGFTDHVEFFEKCPTARAIRREPIGDHRQSRSWNQPLLLSLNW
jgi:hypothetical protein